MVEFVFKYSGLNGALSLILAGISLNLAGYTIYQSRRNDSKRHYLNRQAVHKRHGQIGFEFDQTGDIRYFVTRYQL